MQEARERVKQDALAAGLADDGLALDAGGTGATAYADAVAVYLAIGCLKLVGLCAIPSVPGEPDERSSRATCLRGRRFRWCGTSLKSNAFADAAGGFEFGLDYIAKGSRAHSCHCISAASGAQARCAASRDLPSKIVSTDPPYYDNIGYADLSDFFYVWLRRSLKPVFPDLFATLAVPKAEELGGDALSAWQQGSGEKPFSWMA